MPELKSSVLVPRSLLEEVIYDGCCPLHLRLQLGRLLSVPATKEPVPLTVDMGGLLALNRPCLEAVAGYLPLADVLSVRSCSEEQLQWAMQPEAEERSPRHLVHDRIRTRLCMQRISDLTAGTTDESIFETRLRSLADEALRARMETEMRQALARMEDQIRTFQAEVDRRFEDQERHSRLVVERRVQEELGVILASEVAKVQAMVEERVREQVVKLFRREVQETVRELQGRLGALAEENDMLRDAFAEANFRAKTLFWAFHPSFFRPAFGALTLQRVALATMST